MKKSIIILFCLLFFQIIQAQNEFITIWKPGNAQQIHFPGRGTNFNVAWEEVGYPQHTGNLSNISSTTEFIINFGVPLNPVSANATYKVKISNGAGNFYQVRFFEGTSIPVYNCVDKDKIMNITQWGNIQWQTFESAFVLCNNMDVTAVDSPNLSIVTTTQDMFYICSSLVGNPSFNNWNTSNLTNINSMFSAADQFNAPVGKWNVSNVTDFRFVFDTAANFNQPLRNWNTSNATTMEHMFHGAYSFNQNIDNWNTSGVTNMDMMFAEANNFNQNIGTWNLSSLESAVDMLNLSGLNCQNYDSTLHGWSLNSETPNNIVLSSLSPLVYSHPAAVLARNYLINTKGWTISGDTYNPNCSSVLSTSENISKTEISIYPNPANDFINIRNLKNISSYKIIDFSGRVIQKNNVTDSRIDVTSLQKGNYILEITSKNSIENFKFIKK